MVSKNGFLLFELTIGLVLLFFLLLTSTYYIVQVKNIQRAYINRIEAFLMARNSAEKLYAGNNTEAKDARAIFNLAINRKNLIIEQKAQRESSSDLVMHTIKVAWKDNLKNSTLSLYCIIPEKEVITKKENNNE